MYSVWWDWRSGICAELVATPQRSPCSSPSGRSQQPQTQSSVPVSAESGTGTSCHLLSRGSYLSVSWRKQVAAGEIRLLRLTAEGNRSNSSKCQRAASTGATGTEKGRLWTCYYRPGWTWTHTPPPREQQQQWQGKPGRFMSQGPLREGESAQHLGSKEGETSSKGKTFAGWYQQIESLQTHIQQNVAASHIRHLTMFLQPWWIQIQLDCNPTNTDKLW